MRGKFIIFYYNDLSNTWIDLCSFDDYIDSVKYFDVLKDKYKDELYILSYVIDNN